MLTMTRQEERIANALLSAPGWARVGLTVRDDRTRNSAAQELAACIADELANPTPVIDRDQIALPL